MRFGSRVYQVATLLTFSVLLAGVTSSVKAETDSPDKLAAEVKKAISGGTGNTTLHGDGFQINAITVTEANGKIIARGTVEHTYKPPQKNTEVTFEITIVKDGGVVQGPVDIHPAANRDAITELIKATVEGTVGKLVVKIAGIAGLDGWKVGLQEILNEIAAQAAAKKFPASQPS